MRIIKWPKWYVYLSILFVLAFLIYHFEPTSKIKNEKFMQYLNLEFKGIVVDKFIDTGNHNYKTCLIKENNDTVRFLFDFDRSNAFSYIEKRDSIIKNKGDSVLLIIRKNNQREFIVRY